MRHAAASRNINFRMGRECRDAARSGPRWTARARGHGRAALPRRLEERARRLPGRRRFLRALRLPDHLVAPAGVAGHRRLQFPELLSGPGPAAAARSHRAARRHRARCAALRLRRGGDAAPRADPVAGVLPELVLGLRPHVLLRADRPAAAAAAPVVARRGGAVLSDLAGRGAAGDAPPQRQAWPPDAAHGRHLRGAAVGGMDGVARRTARLPGAQRSLARLLRHRQPCERAHDRRGHGVRLAAGKLAHPGPLPAQRARRGGSRRALLAALDLPHRQRVLVLALSRRLPAVLSRRARARRGHLPSGIAARLGDGPAAAALDRGAQLRDLLVALADLHADPPRGRHPGDRPRKHDPAARPHRDRCRDLVALPRAADPPRCARPPGDLAARASGSAGGAEPARARPPVGQFRRRRRAGAVLPGRRQSGRYGRDGDRCRHPAARRAHQLAEADPDTERDRRAGETGRLCREPASQRLAAAQAPTRPPTPPKRLPSRRLGGRP